MVFPGYFPVAVCPTPSHSGGVMADRLVFQLEMKSVL